MTCEGECLSGCVRMGEGPGGGEHVPLGAEAHAA
jgi:hypothetical protein